jgi:hypothetical protein
MARHVSPASPPDEPRDEDHGLASDKTIISSFKKTINAVALSLATRPRDRSRFLCGLVIGLLASHHEALSLILDHWRT